MSNMSSLDAILHSSIVQYTAGFPYDTYGLDKLRSHFCEFRKAFPDLQLIIDYIIVEDDRIIVRASWRCAHKGNLTVFLQPISRLRSHRDAYIYRI